jgi:hypothetical protein
MPNAEGRRGAESEIKEPQNVFVVALVPRASTGDMGH